MKTPLKIAIASAWFIGPIASSQAQNLVQTLSVNLTAYDTVKNRTVRIQTPDLINQFVGTNVPAGHLYLVTPIGNAPGSIGDLNAFLRITSGSKTVLEIPSPTQFNLYQDTVALRTNRSIIISYALNRFSIDSGSVQAELQVLSTWTIRLASGNQVDLSGSGIFSSSVNGWIWIYNVTQPYVPAAGTIYAGAPRAGP